MHDLEAIKQMNPLRELLEQEHGQPERVGRNLFWRCMFHDDADPSLMVDESDTFYCFGCEAHGDLFDYLKLSRGWDLPTAIENLGGSEISEADMLARRIERNERDLARIARENEENKIILAQLQQERAWERYHTNLLDHEEIQAIWTDEGLPFDWQVNYDLGYAPTFWGGESITMPVFTPFDRDPVNIRHRLLHADNGNKYRPERAGLPPSFYWARPDLGVTPDVFMVEGEKKAMVLFRFLYEAGLKNVQVIGIMGAKGSIHDDLVPQLANIQHIYYIPDPDVPREKIKQTVFKSGKPTYLLKYPMKFDDMLVKGYINGTDVINMTHTAPVVKP